MRRVFAAVAVASLAAAIALTVWRSAFWMLLVPVAALVVVGVVDLLQRSNTILRNFPVVGHLRFILEGIAPEIQQYFIERHTDGRPIPRTHRRLVHDRSEDLPATHPFGTELDLDQPGYEGLAHTLHPVPPMADPPRVRVGGPDCTQPYEASLLNVSAMSFGALSGNAIRAIGHGAAAGGFAMNTGEGSLTSHHLAAGCDVVWQIGTGYFGCRTPDGDFDPDAFTERARRPEVVMVELKLSQGAKPGHGGVLPAAKNTEEIARERLVEPHTTVLSPPGHRAFRDDDGLLAFVDRLRELSGGKPVGIKLCVGRRDEWQGLVDRMVATGRAPDFVTVDGAEGGTGAAPLEYSDSVGVPLRPALVLVDRSLRDAGLRDRVRVIASGRLVTAADMVRAFALGADLVNSARAFMLSVGCIQALRCDTNRCPTGVATQDPRLTRGLVVDDKQARVTRFHRNTVRAVLDLCGALGVAHPHDLRPDLVIDAEGRPAPVGV